MKGGIYTIRFDGSPKFYVGKAVNFTQRRACHASLLRHGKHHNPHLQALFNKYGANAMRFVIEERIADRDMRTEREQCWLDAHLRSGLLVNVAADSIAVYEGPKGERETSWNLGRPSPMKGKPRSAEDRAAISAATRGKKKQLTDEQRHACAAHVRGQPAHNRGKPASEEARRRMSEAAKGRKHSEETRKRMSAAHQRRLAANTTQGAPA